MTEYQKILLDILIELDRICRKNDIEYALSYGTTLGVLNFGGFIPWDDDSDVLMTKENWDKFVEACKKDLNEKYVLDCMENNIKYDAFIPMKLRYRNSHVKESFQSEHFVSHTKERGIFVDIQIICGVDENHDNYVATLKKFLWRVIGCIPLVHFKNKKLKYKIIAFRDKYINDHKDSKYWNQIPTCGGAWYAERFKPSSFPKDCIFPFKPCIFEGHEFFTVNKPEEFCIITYGKDCLYPEKYPDDKKTGHIREYEIYD